MSSDTTKAAMVMKCFTDNPGMVIYRDDIVNSTGLTDKQVRTTVANLRQTGKSSPSPNHPGKYIETVNVGQSWQYRPNHIEPPAPQPVKRPSIRLGSLVSSPPEEKVMPDLPKPVARSASDVFERVGKTDRHEIVVKDEAGKLFRLMPL